MPGISVSKICVPFGGGGIDWSSYWATLISATVENAAPTHVVLTFPVAQASLGVSDFTIAGFTISSASWTGSVLTLVLSTPVVMFIGNLTITFVKTGETAVVTNNVNDGNTVAWYDCGDGSATYMTLDGSSKVSQWNDLSGNNNHLLQATEARRPVYGSNKIYFDGVSTIGTYLRTEIFVFSQPEMIYIVYEPVGAKGEMLDGRNGRGSILALNNGLNGTKYFMYAGGGTESVALTNIDVLDYVGDIVIATALINGANSFLSVNGVTASGLSVGASNMGGITLGTNQELGAANYCKGYVHEVIARKVVDDLATRNATNNYLKAKYGVFFLSNNISFDKTNITFDSKIITFDRI